MEIKERNYLIYQFAGEYLCKHAHVLTDSVLEEYFYNPKKNNLDEAFGVVISSAVDWHKPKARNIAYWEESRSTVIEAVVAIIAYHMCRIHLKTIHGSSIPATATTATVRNTVRRTEFTSRSLMR